MTADDRFSSPSFPRTSAYHPEWIIAGVSGGANPLWLTEWLAERLDLSRGMRVLDLGCGRALSSIFLHREFGVQVWATDLWCSASENWQRIRDAGVQGGVFPIHADARSLPFAAEFFDAVVSIDSFPYYGTDDLYLEYLARFVKAGGLVGVAGAGLTNELEDGVPEHLRGWWTRDLLCLHSARWWKRHWDRSGIVDVLVADTLPDGWQRWLDWHRIVAPDNAAEIEALEADQGRNLGYVRVVGRRRVGVQPAEPVVSVRTEYLQKSVLRAPAAPLLEKIAQMAEMQGDSLGASLTVKNLEASVAWYREVLRFEIDRRHEREGKLIAVSLRAGAVELLLTQDDGKKGLDRAKGEGFSLQITTQQDADELAEHARKHGANLDTEPTSVPWGRRIFRLRDPDGFRWTISSTHAV